MSASLARSVFRPTPAAVRPAARTCPVSRFLPSPVARPSSTSTRTVNAVAHLTVGAALAASAFSVLTHPDSLLFDHPPRSAISWTPERHLLNRELHAGSSARAPRTPSPRPRPSTGSSAPAIVPPSFARPVVAAVASADWQTELRLAGVLGRSLSGQ